MASAVLIAWQAERARRLDELFAAHRRLGGAGAGRRTETEQINWALVLRLAGEFQGFARDLHAEGAATFAEWASGGNPRVGRTVRTLLSLGLELDRGNAHAGSLGKAFGRLGVDWWEALQRRHKRTAARKEHLERMNKARNAIAHDVLEELEELRRQGYPVTLATVRVWRNALNRLATTMDETLAAHLARLFGRSAPW